MKNFIMDACFESAVLNFSSRHAIEWLGDPSVSPSFVTYKELGLWSACVTLKRFLAHGLDIDDEIGCPVVAIAIDEVLTKH